jgi:hypothetical protein
VPGGLLVKPIAQFKKTKSNRNVFAASPSIGKCKERVFSMPMMLKKPSPRDMRTKSANTRKGLCIDKSSEMSIKEQDPENEETPKISLNVAANLDFPCKLDDLKHEDSSDSVDSSEDGRKRKFIFRSQ